MRYRRFGAADLEASEVGLPLDPLTSSPAGDEDIVRLLRLAVDLGVTFFDTAGSDERGEELLGRAVRPFRDQVTLATKFGYKRPPPLALARPGNLVHDWSVRAALTALDRSLRRLGTEPVDLFQLHDPDADALASEELFGFLDQQVTKGKIRAYGVALGPGRGWADEGQAAMRERHVAAVQTVYNLVEQEPGGELAAAAAETGAGILARAPDVPAVLDGGRPVPLAHLAFLTRDRDQTLAQAALRFALTPAAVATALPAVTDDRRLAEVVAAADKPDLTAEDLDRLAELHAARFGAGQPQAGP